MGEPCLHPILVSITNCVGTSPNCDFLKILQGRKHVKLEIKLLKSIKSENTSLPCSKNFREEQSDCVSMGNLQYNFNFICTYCIPGHKVGCLLRPKKIPVVPVSYRENFFHGFGGFLLGDLQ